MTDSAVTCPQCGLQMPFIPDLSGRTMNCPDCGFPFTMALLQEPPVVAHRDQPVLATVVTDSPQTTSRRPQQSNFLVRSLQSHVKRCGIRSSIFQGLLIGWTAAMLGFALDNIIGNWPSGLDMTLSEGGDPRSQGKVMAFVFAGMVCPFVAWIIVSLPLLIAAIATLEVKRS